MAAAYAVVAARPWCGTAANGRRRTRAGVVPAGATPQRRRPGRRHCPL